MRDIKAGPAPHLSDKWLYDLQMAVKEKGWSAAEFARRISERFGVRCASKNIERLLKGSGGNRWAMEAAITVGMRPPSVEIEHADDMDWLDYSRRLRKSAPPDEYKDALSAMKKLADASEDAAAAKAKLVSLPCPVKK